MPDLSQLLAQVMSNPQMMAQMTSLAQSLGLQEDGQSCSSPSPCPSQEAFYQQSPSAAHTPPQYDPTQLMGSLMQMANAMSGDERQLALIHALKPFIRPERARKLERAVQVARMSRLAEKAIHTLAQNATQAGDFYV